MIILTDDHRYIDDDTGQEYPSVTKVIQSAGLMGWMPQGEYYLERGSFVHEATALDDQGLLDESTVDPVVAPYLEAWRRYRAESGFVPELIERSFLHPTYRYCGTIDRDGLDIKTGAPCKWHILQAAAYYALMRGNSIPRVSSITRWVSVYLKPDGTYNTHIYPLADLVREFVTFTSALNIHNWKWENKVS